MSSITSFIGGDPKFLTNYFFGLLTIILYAKDKFNTPTYDKEAMGPFSQLPPQLLTIDARYRQGLRTYVFLLLALYTALCIIGPSTFNQQNIQLGFAADAGKIGPVASATFLFPRERQRTVRSWARSSTLSVNMPRRRRTSRAL